MSGDKEGMRATLKPPCEFAVRYVLPAVRFMIAKTLIEKYGFSQSAVAEILGVTQPAVSYYVRSRRGQIWAKKLVRYREVREELERIVKGIVSGDQDLHFKICPICMGLRDRLSNDYESRRRRP